MKQSGPKVGLHLPINQKKIKFNRIFLTDNYMTFINFGIGRWPLVTLAIIILFISGPSAVYGWHCNTDIIISLISCCLLLPRREN